MPEPSLPAADPWEIYERACRSLLWRVRARRLQLGVDSLLAKARQQVERGTPPSESLQQVYRRARAQVIRQLVRAWAGRGTDAKTARRRDRAGAVLEGGIPAEPIDPSPDFHCDAALGGVARWLRAAGYDAAWWPGIEDELLVRKTLASSAIMLTTDRRLMQRGTIARGAVPALLVPNGPSKRGQLAFLFAKLDLPVKQTRCMSCGGRLQPVEKIAVRDRIPPLTYPWRDDYFLCRRCDKLYWEGTHWQRIEQVLAAAQSGASAGDAT